MREKTREPIRILATLDCHYIPYFNVMLFSLLESNPEESFEVYLLHDGLELSEMGESLRILGKRGILRLVRIREEQLNGAPTTDRYPKEIYYRIFAAKYLPDTIDRILYLDPDLVVRQSIRELYDLPMGNAYFAAASHIGNFLHRINEVRLDMDGDMPYINSGVMLINLRLLREEQRCEDVFEYIRTHKEKLILPDQDIISGLYGDRIIPLDCYRYNMTERLLLFTPKMNLDAVRKSAVIIHYCGRNKPWKSRYIGMLNVFYQETCKRLSAYLDIEKQEADRAE